MSDIEFAEELDARGLMCPMPLVNARKAVNNVEVGQILRIIATDKGSIKDFQGWASIAKNVELLDQHEEDEDGKTLYIHMVKRTK